MKTAAILFTGGKDSCLALLKAKQNGFEIKYLLTIIPSSHDSWMWHKPSLKLLKAQEKSLKIPLIIQESKTKKEEEVKDLEKLLKKIKQDVKYIITGGIASRYQSTRITKATKKFNLKILNPLWNLKSERIWEECLKNNFEIILTKISCEGINKKLLGKKIDNKLFKELIESSKKHQFNLEFEGGEAETAVLDMPLFKEKINIQGKTKSEGEHRHFLIINKIELERKKGERKK